MTSDITLFVNPTSGRGRGARAARPAADALRAAGLTVRTVVGTDAADALDRARKAVDGGTAVKQFIALEDYFDFEFRSGALSRLWAR